MREFYENSWREIENLHATCRWPTTEEKKLREELFDRLMKIMITEEELDQIFRALDGYCSQALRDQKKRSRKKKMLEEIEQLKSLLELVEGINLESAVFASIKTLLFPLIESDSSKLQQTILANEEIFLTVHKGDKPVGRPKNFSRDESILLIVCAFQRAESKRCTKPPKGDTARNLTLILLNSAGFHAASANGAITDDIIQKAVERGLRHWGDIVKSFSSK